MPCFFYNVDASTSQFDTHTTIQSPSSSLITDALRRSSCVTNATTRTTFTHTSFTHAVGRLFFLLWRLLRRQHGFLLLCAQLPRHSSAHTHILSKFRPLQPVLT
jgi:hypothetical protein